MANVDNEHGRDPIVTFSMFILIICIFSLNTFISSEILKLILLFLVVGLLVLNFIVNKKFTTIYSIELMWYFFLIYFTFNILYHGITMKTPMVDIFIFIFSICILVLYKVNVNYYLTSFKLIFIISLFHVLGTLLQ